MTALSPTSTSILADVPRDIAGSRFDQRLSKILAHAVDVFYEKGYGGASIRDLSRASGMSLAGLYYYFESKEELLYLIQKHTFTTIAENLRARLENVTDPEQRVRLLILNHLEYFLANEKAMKVLSHEDDALHNQFGAEVARLKREYYRIALGIIEEFKASRRLEFSNRIALLSLFGMMNWIYTWYNRRIDANAAQLAHDMGNLFLQGISRNQIPDRKPRSARRAATRNSQVRRKNR